MQDAAEVRSRKRRSNRAVIVGAVLMAVALLVSSTDLAPEVVSTVTALVGFALVSYGVHVGWLVFYEREPDGPSS